MAMKQKKRHFYSLAETSAKLFDPILRKRAGLNIELIENWQVLVGGDLASVSMPIKIIWQKRMHQDDDFLPATLLIACESFAAMKISHESGEFIQKINAFFGYNAINRIKILQKTIRNKVPIKKIQPPINQQDYKLVEELVANVDDENLRNSLKELGISVFAEKNT